MKNEIFGSNYPYIDYFCQKDALQKVHTINNLSLLFLKNYVLVSQFSGIHNVHSSLERIIIMCMCVHMCKQVCVSFCVYMCVFELTSRLIIKILSMKPNSGILEAVECRLQ